MATRRSPPSRALAAAFALAACGATAAPPPRPPALPRPEPLLRQVEPPGGPGEGAGLPVVAARVFAIGDSQLRWLYGKRTFAQSPFADRYEGIEVAIRPAALDDGGDLLLAAFLAEHRNQYPRATLVYMGDAADLSCTWEYDRFFRILAEAAELPLLMVTSNHDGFYAGNFTQRADGDGKLRYSDMPVDWYRACSEPGSQEDHILTRARAAARIHDALPPALPWATSFAPGVPSDPSGYAGAHLAYVRPLGGGDADAPTAWGVFLDTVDYRDFDLTLALGAGTTGSISAAQLRDLDRALFEAEGLTDGRRAVAVAFGHHTLAQLDPASQERLRGFLDVHPEIVGLVTAHTHYSDERLHRLPSGRSLREVVIGSTSDYGGPGSPQAARLLEIRVAPGTAARGLASTRLELDLERVCGDVAPFGPRDPFGYVSYRLERDDTGDVPTSTWGLFWAWMGDGDLAHYRVAQTAGALLVENRLVRDLAFLYRGAPLELDDGDRAELAALLARAPTPGTGWGTPTSDPSLRGLSGYDLWWDPVLVPYLPLLQQTLLSFGSERLLFERLRTERTASPAARRWFTCHAARAAAAEADRPAPKDHVYIR